MNKINLVLFKPYDEFVRFGDDIELQITRQSEYAIKTLVELTKTPTNQLIHSRTIAENQELPERFLNKIIQTLVRAGLIETRRGMGGGIRLAVAPESITVADVINIVEGSIVINPCLANNFHCPSQSNCRLHLVFNRAQKALLAELKKETLADLAELDSCI